MRRTAASADAVKAMHEAFCAVGDHAETRHPCLAWSAKGNRDRRRKLVAELVSQDQETRDGDQRQLRDQLQCRPRGGGT